MSNYNFNDKLSLDAFLIPGGSGTRQEIYNERLHSYIEFLNDNVILRSVCTGSWIYVHMGLLDGIAAKSRKEDAE